MNSPLLTTSVLEGEQEWRRQWAGGEANLVSDESGRRMAHRHGQKTAPGTAPFGFGSRRARLEETMGLRSELGQWWS